jgi:N-acetylglutamate synthase-like GNAT family acetyltransferase
MSEDVNFDTLRFIRVFTPMHVPKDLIEQVRDREYEVEDWYKYQEIICLRQTDAGPQLNPLSMLYVIADEGNKVVGMLWCEVHVLSKTLVIQTFSMDKKYWNKGKAVTLLSKKAKEIAKGCNLKKIAWVTNYPQHSLRYGFKRSKGVVMEWREEYDEIEEKEKNLKEEQNGEHFFGRINETGRGGSTNDSGTTELSKSNIRESGTSGSGNIPANSAAANA